MAERLFMVLMLLKNLLSISMTTVQLPGIAAYDSHMEMHTSTENTEISLAREFQKHLSKPTWAHGFLDHGKDIKCISKQKWTDSEYHVQYRKYVLHISVKIPCATTQFPASSFFSPHAKHNVVRRLNRHYNL